MWGVFAQFKKNADAERENSAGYGRSRTAAESGLWTARRDRLPCNKRPTDLADVVEHVASLRHPFGPRLASTGILNHMLSDVVAQTVDLILVTVLEHAGEVRHARLKAIEGIATRRLKVRNLRQGTHLNEDIKGIHKAITAGNRGTDGVHQVQVIARAGVGDHRDSTTSTSRSIKLGKRAF